MKDFPCLQEAMTFLLRKKTKETTLLPTFAAQ